MCLVIGHTHNERNPTGVRRGNVCLEDDDVDGERSSVRTIRMENLCDFVILCVCVRWMCSGVTVRPQDECIHTHMADAIPEIRIIYCLAGRMAEDVRA